MRISKSILLSGVPKSGKSIQAHLFVERCLNKLRFHSNKYITLFSVKYGRNLRDTNFDYYYYTVILRFKKWYQKPFYTLRRHLKIYGEK